MMQGIRSIPTTAKPPPAPQAKPVPYAARNTAFSVTHGASGHPLATARTPADASAATATQLRMKAAAAAPKRPPAPQAKPVKNATRNTTFSVTTGARGRLTTPATARTPADASAATQKRLEAAAAATRPATLWECAILAEGVTTAVTHGASGHPPATARTPAAARTTAAKLILQSVPVAKQPAAPKRSVRCVVGNTAKKTQITMIWCSTKRKPPPVRNPAGTLTKPAPAATIPPMQSSPR